MSCQTEEIQHVDVIVGLCSFKNLRGYSRTLQTVYLSISYSVAGDLKSTDMAVFCVDEHSELIAFTEAKLGPVSLLMFVFLKLSQAQGMMNSIHGLDYSYSYVVV